MGILVLYILLVCIWHSFLIYSYDLGLNVILFMAPLLGIIYYALKKSNKINNKKGLLFMIPILLLSLTYFLYDNPFFKFMNGAVSILLFTFLYIYTVKPTYNISFIIKDIFAVICEPLNVIGDFFKEINIIKLPKVDSKIRNRIISVTIVIPIVLVVLLLLSSADMMFDRIFSGFFNTIFSIRISLDDFFWRTASIIVLFTCIGSTIYFLMNNYEDLKQQEPESRKIENFTIKLLLTVLNIIYILFDIIQVRSLLFHQVAKGIKYAEYAREGFFQLMFISLINLAIILLAKKVKEKDDKYIKNASMAMVFLTLIIIISSFLRMNLYEAAYGYTLLRLLVYTALITEVILLVPTVFYILKENINIVKYYMIILVSIYTVLALLPVDRIIAKRNIDRFYDNHELDLEYLKNFSADNIPQLVDLYETTDDETFQLSLEEYFGMLDNNFKIKGFQDYNISKVKAVNALKKVK